MDSKEFIKLYLLNNEYKDNINKISKEYGIEKSKLWEWYEKEKEYRGKISRIKGIFNAKMNKCEANIKFTDTEDFCDWYMEQKQECYYCRTDENVIKELFSKKIIHTERDRGKNLEVDRKDANCKEYSRDNCVLACYICNNTKSDMMNSEEFQKYFGDIIHKYLMDKYNNSK